MEEEAICMGKIGNFPAFTDTWIVYRTSNRCCVSGNQLVSCYEICQFLFSIHKFLAMATDRDNELKKHV